MSKFSLLIFVFFILLTSQFSYCQSQYIQIKDDRSGNFQTIVFSSNNLHDIKIQLINSKDKVVFEEQLQEKGFWKKFDLTSLPNDDYNWNIIFSDLQNPHVNEMYEKKFSIDRSNNTFISNKSKFDKTTKPKNSPDEKSNYTNLLDQYSSVVIYSPNDEQIKIYNYFKEDIDFELSILLKLIRPEGEFGQTKVFETRQEDNRNNLINTLNYYERHWKTNNVLKDSINGLINRFNSNIDELRKSKNSQQKDQINLRKFEVTKGLIIDSYEEFVLDIAKVGTYNANQGTFEITTINNKFLLNVEVSEAPEFKINSAKYKVIGSRQLNESGNQFRTFNYFVITDQGRVFDSQNQLEPLYMNKSSTGYLLKETVSTMINKLEQKTVVNREIAQTTPMMNVVFDRVRAQTYHALIITINDYATKNINDLDAPIRDGERLENILTTQYNFNNENVKKLVNPTRSEIIQSFDNLSNKITLDDNLIIFYAGHGVWDEKLNQGYWLPSDATSNSKVAWLSNSTIRDYIGGIKSKHTLLITDACFSGGIFKMRDVFIKNAVGYAHLYKNQSRKAITSGNLSPVPDRSVFMDYLIKKLKENEQALLSSEELFMSLKIPVANNSVNEQVPQFGDILNAGDEGGDFIFVQY